MPALWFSICTSVCDYSDQPFLREHIMLVKVLAPAGYSERLREINDGILMLRGNQVNFKENLTSLQLIGNRDFEQRTLSGTAAAGIVGAALLGPLGAIGGMLFGGRKRQVIDVTVSCALSDGRIFILQGSHDLYAMLQKILPNSGAPVRPTAIKTSSDSLAPANQVREEPSRRTLGFPEISAKLDSLGDKVGSMTIDELADKFGATDRGIRAALYRRGQKCADL